MPKLNFSILLFAVVFGGLSLAAQATTYDNSTFGSDITPFGNQSGTPPGTSTYGQVFTAPPEQVLNDWTFYLKVSPTPAANLNFQFDLAAWDGTNLHATGPMLYTSATQILLTSQSTYEAFTVTPNVTLTPGSGYVMFINTSGLNGSNSTNASVGGNALGTALGGGFYFQNSNSFSDVTTLAWSAGSSSQNQMQYIADFSSPVPELGSTTLLLLGMGCVGIMVLVRRSKLHVAR